MCNLYLRKITRISAVELHLLMIRARAVAHKGQEMAFDAEHSHHFGKIEEQLTFGNVRASEHGE